MEWVIIIIITDLEAADITTRVVDPEYVRWADDDTTAAALEQALRAGQDKLQVRDRAEQTGPHLLPDTPAYRHQMAVRTSSEARRLSRAGYVLNVASQQLLLRSVIRKLLVYLVLCQHFLQKSENI